MAKAGSFVDAAVGRVKNGTPFPGVRQEQLLQLIVILDAKQYGDGFAVSCNYHRPGRTRFDIRTESGFDLSQGSYFHRSTSSLARNSRFLSFTATSENPTTRDHDLNSRSQDDSFWDFAPFVLLLPALLIRPAF
jgi:hypothetical protein